jgi:hypothetical protein
VAVRIEGRVGGRRVVLLAWAMWALTMLAMLAVPWLYHLERQAAGFDFALPDARGVVAPLLASVSAATVGAVLASRRPHHPVGWLLLTFGLSVIASGVAEGMQQLGRSIPAGMQQLGRSIPAGCRPPALWRCVFPPSSSRPRPCSALSCC